MPKKKTALTIEERLQQALVPAEEQPYVLPENWVWTYIYVGFEVTSSKRVHKSDWLSKGVPFYRTRELVKLSEDGYVDNELFISFDLYKKFKNEFGVPKCGDLLISGVGTIGVPYVVSNDEKFYFKDGNIIWLKNKELFMARYMYYLYKSVFIFNQIHGMSAGTTVDTYTIINAKNTIIPVPPLAEQQRIVERIEELFAKLDEAKEKLQEVVDSFAVRKAAILHKAFTGELTQKWRKENGVELSSWEEKSISEICSSLKYGTSKKSSDIGDVIVLRMGNLQNGEIDWKNLAYTNDKDDIEKYYLKSGDVLFNRTNSPDLVGKTSIYRGEYPAIYAGYLIKLDYEPSKIIGEFLNYYLNSPIAKEYYIQVKTDGVSQSNINAKKIGEFLTPLPSLPEQHEIVRLIDSLLARERKAQEAAKQALASIELMKKSILAKAFRGELGTNKASEASALELLKQVLEQEK